MDDFHDFLTLPAGESFHLSREICLDGLAQIHGSQKINHNDVDAPLTSATIRVTFADLFEMP